MGKFKTIAVWVLSALFAVLFVIIGVSMLIDYEGKASKGFADFGYPDWFRVLIGVLDIAGGLLLLLPRFAWLGSATLAAIMAGAVVTHLKAEQYFPEPLPAAVFFVILALITFMRWPRSANKAV